MYLNQSLSTSTSRSSPIIHPQQQQTPSLKPMNTVCEMINHGLEVHLECCYYSDLFRFQASPSPSDQSLLIQQQKAAMHVRHGVTLIEETS